METHIQSLARAKVDLGAEVSVICVNAFDEKKCQSLRTTTVKELDKNVQVLSLGRILSFARFDLCPETLGKLREVVNDSYSIIHLHTPNPMMLLALMMTGCRIPVVISHHSDVIKPLQALISHRIPLVYFSFQSHFKQYPPPFNWIERFAISRAAGWICSGQTVAETLKHRQGYSLPMRLIPLGVDVNSFYPSPDAGVQIRRSLAWEEQGAPVIGYLGRLVPEKGLDLLMRVLDRLQTPWRALFVGTGPMEATLRTWANRHGDRVRICTDVKHSDVPQYLNAMDILCAPSQTTPQWREQFGRMLVEAFACGVPVIGSDSGEIPYVIQDAGVVVGERDEQSWVQALSDLLESPSRRQELAEKGLHRAHAVYAWPIIAKQYLEFFTELLDSQIKQL